MRVPARGFAGSPCSFSNPVLAALNTPGADQAWDLAS
jgi:hypothetical protein